MGSGVRVFFVDENDCLKRVPYARLNRLTNFDPSETLKEYAGKLLRYALIILGVEKRKPIKIYHIYYGILPFDQDGRIDKEEWYRMIELVMESSLVSIYDQPKKVIDATDIFAQKRLKNEFSWKPTEEIKSEIIKSIFKQVSH